MKRVTMIAAAAAAAVLLAPTLGGAADGSADCQIKRLRHTARYTRCRLNAEASAIRRGEQADLDQCQSRYAKALARLEAGSGGECSDQSQAVEIQTEVGQRAGGIAAVVAAPGLIDVDARRRARFGPLQMTADQDVILGAFLPPLSPPGLAEQVDPPYNVALRLFDDTGTLLAYSTEPVSAGTGVALRVAGTDIFEGRIPPYITAEVFLERSPPVLPEDPRSVAGGQIPPTVSSLQLIDAATGHLDLILGQDPPFLPEDPRSVAGGWIPPYLPPIHVSESDDLLLAYAGVGGETVRLALIDETGLRRWQSEPLTVAADGGGVTVSVDGATVAGAVTPNFVVGLVELLAPAEVIDPPYLPGLFSVGVLDLLSGRTRGLSSGRALLAAMPQAVAPPPGCDPSACEPVP